MGIENTIETTLMQIQKVMGANSIMGHPITVKDKTIIPISKVALGFGVGSADHDNSSINIGGAGGGGSIDPIAFLVIYENVPGPEGIELVRLDENSPMEDLLSGVGNMIMEYVSNSSNNNDNDVDDIVNGESNIDKIKTKLKN